MPSCGAFHDTRWRPSLRNLGRDTMIVTGTLTNLCCGTTARQAYERGSHVVVGSDVTATNDPAVHEHELMTLRYGFARVLTAEEIVRALNPGTHVRRPAVRCDRRLAAAPRPRPALVAARAGTGQ